MCRGPYGQDGDFSGWLSGADDFDWRAGDDIAGVRGRAVQGLKAVYD
jgi:hypothetical protein